MFRRVFSAVSRSFARPSRLPMSSRSIFRNFLQPSFIRRSKSKRAKPAKFCRKIFRFTTAIRQWGNVGALVAGLSKGDYDLIARSLEDFVAEPFRKKLIPHFDELKIETLKAGALGGGISGSGPSVFMLSENLETARKSRKCDARNLRADGN